MTPTNDKEIEILQRRAHLLARQAELDAELEKMMSNSVRYEVRRYHEWQAAYVEVLNELERLDAGK